MAVKAPGRVVSSSPSSSLPSPPAREEPEPLTGSAGTRASPSARNKDSLSSSFSWWPEPEAPAAATPEPGPEPNTEPGLERARCTDSAGLSVDPGAITAQDSAESYAEARLAAAAAASFAGPVVGVVPPRLAPGPRSPATGRSATLPCREEEVFFEPAIGNRAGHSGEEAKIRAKTV